jgi:hypothetical protein
MENMPKINRKNGRLRTTTCTTKAMLIIKSIQTYEIHDRT